jgi:dTDP-4-amino-4,6-dideoxygalactose transaminase
MRVRYRHESIGVNSRLDTLQAAVLQVKLKYLEEYTAARQQTAAQYDKAFGNLEGIIIPHRCPCSTHVFNQYTIKTEGIDRDELQKKLSEKGVRSAIYYPSALHRQPAFGSLATASADCPAADRLCQNVLSLPVHPDLDADTVNCVIRSVVESVSEV